MAVPNAPCSLYTQLDVTGSPVVRIPVVAVDLGGGKGVQGTSGVATYSFVPQLTGAPPPSLRALCDLMDKAVRDGEATVT